MRKTLMGRMEEEKVAEALHLLIGTVSEEFHDLRPMRHLGFRLVRLPLMDRVHSHANFMSHVFLEEFFSRATGSGVWP